MLSKRISHLNPCSKACEWLDTQPDADTAWRNCPRGDWMLWLIGKQIKSEPWAEDRKHYLACALDCVENKYGSLWPQQTKDSVAVLRAWITGTASVEEAKAARTKLQATATAAYAAATVAADADVAVAAAAALSEIGYTGAVAAAAAAAADDVAAADIVRKHYPMPPVIGGAV